MKKRRILSLLVSLAMCLSILPTAVFATDEHSEHPVCGETCSCDSTHDAMNWTEWSATTYLPTNAGNYYLTADVTLSSAEWEPANGTVLCLNGHNIIGAPSETVINVAKGYTFTLTDCNKTTPGKITHNGIKTGRGISVDENAVFNMYGGKITGNEVYGNNNTGYGGGVCCLLGTFNMYGGSITDNIADSSGGGVYVENGVFNMYNSTISNNKAKSVSGGGVYMFKGTFNMHNSTISNNTELSYWGGGVCTNTTDITMENSNIIGNTAGFGGGGLYVQYGTI